MEGKKTAKGKEERGGIVLCGLDTVYTCPVS